MGRGTQGHQLQQCSKCGCDAPERHSELWKLPKRTDYVLRRRFDGRHRHRHLQQAERQLQVCFCQRDSVLRLIRLGPRHGRRRRCPHPAEKHGPRAWL